MKTESISEVTFPALQGGSLLGFLAALGAFRTLAATLGASEIRMRWIPSGISYCPQIRSQLREENYIIALLHAALQKMAGHRVLTADKNLKIPCPVFRRLAIQAVNHFLSGEGDFEVGMVSAFGCDAIGNEEGNIEDTGFRTMSGAGHQHFLEFMNILAKETTAEQVREALFGPWRYRDPSPTLRWDAEDDRRYALRWDEPSGDPVRTVRGANLLAIASLPLFPVVPSSSHRIVTTGFSGRGSRGTFVTWPVWSTWLSIDTARSLLALAEIQEGEACSAILKKRGIAAVYRSRRITLGKFRNFTPAEPL